MKGAGKHEHITCRSDSNLCGIELPVDDSLNLAILLLLWKSQFKVTVRAFKSLRNILARFQLIPSFQSLVMRLQTLVGHKAQKIDCCVNSCMAFTGCYEDLEACLSWELPYYYSANRPRLNPNARIRADRVSQKSRKQFIYFPIIIYTAFKDFSTQNLLTYKSRGYYYSMQVLKEQKS